MSCAACQAHVAHALRETPGVADAEVNLMTHTARIVFDPEVTDPTYLVEAVRDSGYESSLPAVGDDMAQRESHAHHGEAGEGPLRWRAIWLLGMAALAMLASMPLMRDMHAGIFSRMAMQLLPAVYRIPAAAIEFPLLALALAGMALSFGEVYKPAWNAMLHRTTNMNTLVALGTIAALSYSAVSTIAPSLFRNHGLNADVYYESVLFILAFLMLGRWLEARAKSRTQDALLSFAKLQPQMARVIQHGQEVEVPLSSVRTQDTVVLRPGERVPVDGVVLSGATTVDESLLTGESLPVARVPGDKLIGGSLNYDGAIEYRATSVGGNGVLGQMLRMMEEAQASRAPTQQLADRVSAVFVPVVLGIAALTFLVWAALEHGSIGHAFAAAVTVLVIACPCAMGLAVPAALTVAIGRGAQLGILFKNGEALERLARIDTVVLDKTGTLTAGKPQIAVIAPASGVSETELLHLAGSLEQRSEHPLAHAVIERATATGLALSEVLEARAVPGKGIVGTVGGRNVAAGNEALFSELGIALPAIPKADEGSTLLVAIDGTYSGYFVAKDKVRDGAGEAIRRLEKHGMKAIMLTGDNAATANSIGRLTGIAEIYSGLLPAQKLQHIRALQASGKRVAMVGDGINDAAALVQADGGIAMGTGTDLAREAGDAVLLRGEPISIPAALDLASATLRTMRENLGWAVGYNLIGIPLAAGVLYPAFGILLSPAIASAAMALSSVSVLANSLRLRGFQSK
jgi:Cu+-exporting ATPase